MLKRILFRILIILTIIIVQYSYGFGSIFFVDKNSGNDANPGNETQPWKTIQHAAGSLQQGDTVFVKNGVYNEVVQPVNSGTVTQPIVYIVYPGDSVVIDGSGIELWDWYGLFTLNTDYIELNGFNIRNAEGAGIHSEYNSGILLRNLKISNVSRAGMRLVMCTQSEVYNNKVDSCCLVDNWEAAVVMNYVTNSKVTDNSVSNSIYGFGVAINNSNDVIVDSNLIHNTYLPGISAIDTRNVLVLNNDISLACNGGGGECISLENVDTFSVRQNEVHDGGGGDYGGEGIDVGHSRSGDISDNFVYNVKRVGIYINTMGPPAQDILVTRNRVYDCDMAGIAVATEQPNLVENIVISYNCIANCKTEGIIIADWVNDALRRNISIINNTVYNCGSLYGGGIQVRTDQVENVIVRNNLCSMNHRFQIAIVPDAVDEVTVDYNLINGQQIHGEAYYGNYAVIGDPLFSDAINYDFTLAEPSPAIDSGHPDIQYYDPDSTRNDIGAYYFEQTDSYICGDANSDDDVNVSDAVYIINYVFVGGDPPDPLEPADTNCDGDVNVSDAVWLINFVFIGGHDPCDTNGDGIPDC